MEELPREPYLFKEMKTARLTLIKIAPVHRDDIYAYASDAETVRHMSWPRHESPEKTAAFIDLTCELYEEECHYDWAVYHRRDRKVIGTIGLHNRNRRENSVEMGYILNKEYWGRGLIPEAARRLLEFGFDDLKVDAVKATCDPQNRASERVMKKLGMTFQGISDVKLIKYPAPVPHKVYRISRQDLAKKS